jgi:ribosome maturation factor RimP
MQIGISRVNMVKEEEFVEKVTSIIMPIIERAGMELVDLEYRKEGGGWVLRLFIDKEGGVTLDDCTDISNEVGEALDVADLIQHGYNLEVSSPGLNRPLKKEADFKRFIGKLAKVKTLEAIGGSRNFKGRIVGCENGILSLNIDGVIREIPIGKMARANLEYEF